MFNCLLTVQAEKRSTAQSKRNLEKTEIKT